jgi:PAS domain-containing protein
MESIVIAIISALGIGLGSFLTYLYNKRQASNEEKKIDNQALTEREKNAQSFSLEAFKIFREAYENDLKDLRGRVLATEIAEKKCREDYDNLEEKFEKLKLNLKLLELALPELPTPMWTKSSDGIILRLNKAFEDKYLRPLGKWNDEYIGKTDIEFWGKDIGSVYHNNDLLVMKTGKTQVFKEPVLQADGTIKHDFTIKYVRKIDDQYVIGLGGIALEGDIVDMLLLLK